MVDSQSDLGKFAGDVRSERSANISRSLPREVIPHLTPRQQEVYTLYFTLGKTPKSIAKRLNTSPRAVQRIIERIREKGCAPRSFGANILRGTPANIAPVAAPESVSESARRGRLHAVRGRVIVPVEWRSEAFVRAVKKTVEIDGCNVFVWEGSVEFRLSEGMSFFGSNRYEAMDAAMPFLTGLIGKVEQDFNILLLKPRRQNVVLDYFEFSEIENEIAKDYVFRGRPLVLTAPEDGSGWLKIDDSFGLNELEFIRTRSLGEDERKVMRKIQDWRAHETPTDSEFSRMFFEQQRIIAEAGLIVRSVAVRQSLVEERVMTLFKLEADRMKKAADDFESRVSVGSVSEVSDLSELRRMTG